MADYSNKNKTANNQKLNALIFGGSSIESLKNSVRYIIEYNDVFLAKDLSSSLKEIMAINSSDLDNNQELKNFYKKILVKSKLIALPLLEERDFIEIFKNYFTWQFRIPNYDIIDKFNQKMIYESNVEKRDSLKNKIKQALLENKEVIASKASKKTIQEWLTDYNAAVGPQPADNLKRREYFINLQKDKSLDELDRKKLQILINFYEAVKTPSSTPQGFENNIPVMMNGRLYIFNNGVLEQVKKPNVPDVEDILSSVKVPVNGGELDNSKKIENGRSRSIEISKIEELMKKYDPDSLEYRALKEELSKHNNKRDEK